MTQGYALCQQPGATHGLWLFTRTSLESRVSRDPLNIALAVMAVLLLVVGGPVLMRRLRGPEPLPGSVATLPAAAGQEHRTLKVSGMMCANCVQTIGDALQSTKGVVSADVDLDTGRADVLCEKAVADSALVGAVARSGKDYSATVASH